MKIILRDINEDLVDAWKNMFADAPDVTCEVNDIFSHPQMEAIVSPANSFGFMNGGIDAVYARRWPNIQKDVQAAILWEYKGELPVGCAVVTPISDAGPNDFSTMICAPTMRTPCDVSNTINAYLAFRAVLLCAKKYNIEHVTCPGLGTAVGNMSPMSCAIQMREAYGSINRSPPKTITEAYKNSLGLSNITKTRHELIIMNPPFSGWGVA